MRQRVKAKDLKPDDVVEIHIESAPITVKVKSIVPSEYPGYPGSKCFRVEVELVDISWLFMEDEELFLPEEEEDSGLWDE